MPNENEVVYFNCLGPAPHGDPPHTPQVFTFEWPGYSRNYEKVSPSAKGRHSWNNFEHFRSVQGENMKSLLPIYTEKWSSNPHVQKGWFGNIHAGYHLHYLAGSSLPYGSPGALNNGLPRWDLTLPDGHFVPEPPQLENLISDSLRVMMPGIKAEMSLINSVIELKDFKGIVQSLSRVVKRFNTLLPTVNQWLRKRLVGQGTNPTLKDLSQKAAGAILSWNFAWKPLLSDIDAIQRVISRTERRMNDLLTRTGRRQTRHYTVSYIEYPNEEHQGDNPGEPYLQHELNSVCLYDVTRKVFYEPSIFHAEIEYRYYLSQYQRDHARTLSILDGLGVNLNPSIIWNAIPWSFLVDWVAGVSQWLDSMGMGNMEPRINIRRYLWSVRRSRRIVVDKGISRSYYGLPPEGRSPLPVVIETAYRRDVGLPGWNSFMTSGISSRELMLGASLLIAKRRRYHRRG